MGYQRRVHGDSQEGDQILTIRKMLKFVVALLFLAGASQAQTIEKGLLCDICVDVVTDLDEWLTSDATMDEILKFVEGLCHALGAIDPTLETLCVSLIEARTLEGLTDSSDNTPSFFLHKYEIHSASYQK